ncbi:hypothetical protein OS493_038959, partial [Desmophyllum pertusum]
MHTPQFRSFTNCKRRQSSRPNNKEDGPGTRTSMYKQGAARNSPGAARSSQEQPRPASSQDQPAARTSQDQPKEKILKQ